MLFRSLSQTTSSLLPPFEGSAKLFDVRLRHIYSETDLRNYVSFSCIAGYLPARQKHQRRRLVSSPRASQALGKVHNDRNKLCYLPLETLRARSAIFIDNMTSLLPLQDTLVLNDEI